MNAIAELAQLLDAVQAWKAPPDVILEAHGSPSCGWLPVAESAGLILPLGSSMLKIACRQLARWSADPATEHLTVAINVSALQMRQKNFVEQVRAIIEQTGADPQRRKIELTESTLVSNVEDVIVKMEKF